MIRDVNSPPRIDESLHCLNRVKLFTALDLKLRYWQAELHKVSTPLTAFTVGLLDFYECERMLFGLTNAPATFKNLMEFCLDNFHLNWYIIYLDDTIIFLKIPKKPLQRLKSVLEKLSEVVFKLKPSKCEFFKKLV